MKRTIFAAIAVVSITVVAGIDAAEVRKALTALRAQPIPTDTFNSNLPRHSVGYYRYAVDLTIPGPSRQTIEANDFTTLWHEKRNGNTTLLWQMEPYRKRRFSFSDPRSKKYSGMCRRSTPRR